MRIPLLMPQVTLTMSDAVILRWLVEQGAKVQEGQPLLEIETDKTTVEVPAPQEGTLVQLVAREMERVAVGQAIAFLEADVRADGVGDQVASSARSPDPASGVASRLAPTPRDGEPPTRQRVSPVAARLAREHGVDLRKLAGSGPAGLIVEADVRRWLESPLRSLASSEPDEVLVPLSPLRRRIAERMLLSTTSTATVTTVAEVDMGEVRSLRQKVPVSYTVFAVRASALALRRFPHINSELRGDNIVLKRGIHVGVAVSLDEALVVPVIRDAEGKPLPQIAEELEQLTVTARSGRLRPEQTSGGTFTVTNSGVFGSLLFTPVINYPQAATLGMGKVMETPVVRDGGIFVRPVMYLCLSYDHRIIDGAVAVKYLQEVKRLLEHPEGELLAPQCAPSEHPEGSAPWREERSVATESPGPQSGVSHGD